MFRLVIVTKFYVSWLWVSWKMNERLRLVVFFELILDSELLLLRSLVPSIAETDWITNHIFCKLYRKLWSFFIRTILHHHILAPILLSFRKCIFLEFSLVVSLKSIWRISSIDGDCLGLSTILHLYGLIVKISSIGKW